MIFAPPKRGPRKKIVGRNSGKSNIHLPSHEKQAERLDPKFEQLEAAFEARRLDLVDDPSGNIPEQVLVLETIGTVEEFITVVRNVKGMEWLSELDENEIKADDDFYDTTDKGKNLNGRLYLVMTNQQAINKLLSLWKKFKANEWVKFERGLAGLKKIFKQLKDIRTWGVKDRLDETGIIDDWNERISNAQQEIPFEVELWYSQNKEVSLQRQDMIRKILEGKGGRIVKISLITEISYHAILAMLPEKVINDILNNLDNPDVKLIRYDQIMFFRPTGQSVVITPSDEITASFGQEQKILPSKEPIVALLDGLPLENHNLLMGRLIVDDPDNWSEQYPSKERNHATAMASLIIHDELDANSVPLNRPLYVRPIMKPNPRNFTGTRSEYIPDDELPVDLVHRSIIRIFEGERGILSIIIINLSICDPSRLFDRMMSPWAKLIDWLSWKYKLLFVISAGNHTDDIELEVPRAQFSSFEQDKQRRLTIKALAKSAIDRRIMSPAESINSLTIASSHADLCKDYTLGNRFDPFNGQNLPSPFNSIGLGFMRSIKPDVLNRGGRQFYMEKPGNAHNHATLQINQTNLPPGQKVASPSKGITGIRYSRGTSNSAAVTTRLAAQLYDIIEGLEQSKEIVNRNNIASLLKALIVHSSLHEDSYGDLEDVLREFTKERGIREYIHRFVGYGAINQDRILHCTEQRATLIGCGFIVKDESVVYSLPLPIGLSGKKDFRRLVITLAWVSPITLTHRKYRKAFIEFKALNYEDKINVKREDYDHNAVKRGTVQHEVYEGKKATAFTQNDKIEIQIECKENAGTIEEKVPYAIVTTFEVAEGVNIPVYDQIQQQLKTIVKIQPSG